MLLKTSIPAARESDPAVDPRQLFELGLATVRRFSHQQWTDHNTHDPGITQLEVLAYVLTELAYRAGFPIEDLLAAEEGNAAAMAAQFASAGRILPSAPVTLADYRKLLIDLPQVRNAWLLPAPVTLHADPGSGRLRRAPAGVPGEQAVTVSGRYRVLLDLADEVRSADQRQAVARQALAVLHANRGLGMDFVEPVRTVPTQRFNLCAEIEVAIDADPDQLAAAIRFAVDRFLAPPVPNHTLAEMLARHHPDGSAWTLPEIFAGPRLNNGFIADDDLAAAGLRSEIRLSDLIGVIMDIPGVLAIRDILINPLDAGGQVQAPADPWRLPVLDGHLPRLAESGGRLVLYKKNLPLQPDPASVSVHFNALAEAERRKLESGVAEDWPIPLGRYRDPGRYLSVQGEFPECYGISAAGLDSRASPARRAQALQFKAWLSFFDHVLAGFVDQLAQLRQLFGSDPGALAAYGARVIDSFPEWQAIYAADFTADELPAIVAEAGVAVARRNRFLDHLLARYGEDFSDYVAVVHSRFGSSAGEAVAAKCAFLDACPDEGGRRGCGHDVSRREPAALWNTDANISGFERRVARLLGIVNPARRNLSAVPYDMYAQLDRTPGDEFRFRLRHPVSGKILLSSSCNYPTPETARAEMETAIRCAQQAEGYELRETSDGRHYFNIVDGRGEVVARRIEYFSDLARMEAAIAELIEHLRTHYSGEGMYLIEHLLLLDDDGPLLDICNDPDCAAGNDPYSHRLTIVLPAYAGRFQDIDFRRFVDTTLRQEAPAHLLPRICWVNSDDMAAIEGAWRDWLAIRAGAERADREQKLGRLIEVLTRAKNVYPASALHPCGQIEPPPFILGRAALGSAPELPQA